IGYFFNDKNDLGIELNFDHAKYVMEDSQTVHLTGRIHGVDYNKDTLVTPSFLKFEHTNGANFLMANLIKRVRYKYYPVVGIVKLGAGVVIPKTDVTLFGERLDNVFHVAGYIVGAEAGLRYKFYKHFFIEASAKGAYANYTNVLTVGTGKANHHFFVGEYILNGGVSFPL
ncbi:MAG: hypothetical protein NTX03_09730, partial [Bacteroidetes bacterium]|nr:hypothetical protein [Bacteroidota bacterium]